jgi:hypothetical protein
VAELFLNLYYFFAMLTQAREGTTWATAPSRRTSHEHRYMLEHIQAYKKIIILQYKGSGFKSSLIVVKSM